MTVKKIRRQMYKNAVANGEIQVTHEKYVIFRNPFTGEYLGKAKTYGNNRKNTCKRGKQSRNPHLN